MRMERKVDLKVRRWLKRSGLSRKIRQKLRGRPVHPEPWWQRAWSWLCGLW